MNKKNNLLAIVILLIINCTILVGCENKEIEVMNQENLALKEELTNMQNEITNYKEQVSELTTELQKQIEYNQIYISQIDELENGNQINELKNKSKDLQDENNELNDKVDGLKTQLYYGNHRLHQLNKYISMIQNRKKQIENVIEPKYILNVFDPLEVEKGDIIAGLTVEYKSIETFENIDACVYEDIEFYGKYKLEGKIYINKDFDSVEILIDKSQFANIPLHINYIDIDSMYMTILNGDELINSLGDKYIDGIEIIALYSGFRYHNKIEAEKMIDTTFIELISIKQ